MVATDQAVSAPARAGALGHALRGVRDLISELAHIWRRSLQFRVVSSAMVLGMIVVSLLGAYLYQAIASGLETSRVTSAQAQAQALTSVAQTQFDAVVGTNLDDLDAAAYAIVTSLSRSTNDAPFEVLFTRSRANANASVLQTFSSGNYAVSDLSEGIREAVSRDPDRLQTQSVVLPDATGNSVPAVIVGSSVEVPLAGRYDLYFITLMTQEEDTLGLIRSAFLLGGVALTALIGAIAWLLARQVVAPVRRAAAVATRLASGNLSERLATHGEDDLARLATSFNAMAESLQTQIGQLETLSAVQQRFVSDVSHELRTPLTTVRMAADLIFDSRESFEPALARSAELLHHELDRFELLLGDLLEISRYDAGAAILDEETVDLAGLATKVVHESAGLAARHGSALQVHVPTGECNADVDPRRVERILRNLVNNAIEHGERRPIDVVVAANATAVSILVVDQGVGFAVEDAQRVFDRFWRADPSRKRSLGGTGLGLAISLEDARLHEGLLEAWGMPGAGARFRLTLPVTRGVPMGDPPLGLAPGEDWP